jgi:hypothetical protein
MGGASRQLSCRSRSTLFYLGPPESMTTVGVPAALCRDADFVKRRLERLSRFGPPIEVQNVKKACGL